jgi:hypothetical protein
VLTEEDAFGSKVEALVASEFHDQQKFYKKGSASKVDVASVSGYWGNESADSSIAMDEEGLGCEVTAKLGTESLVKPQFSKAEVPAPPEVSDEQLFDNASSVNEGHAYNVQGFFGESSEIPSIDADEEGLDGKVTSEMYSRMTGSLVKPHSSWAEVPAAPEVSDDQEGSVNEDDDADDEQCFVDKPEFFCDDSVENLGNKGAGEQHFKGTWVPIKPHSRGTGTPVKQHPSSTLVSIKPHSRETEVLVEEHSSGTCIPIESHSEGTGVLVEPHSIGTLPGDPHSMGTWVPIESHFSGTGVPVERHSSGTRVPVEAHHSETVAPVEPHFNGAGAAKTHFSGTEVPDEPHSEGTRVPIEPHSWGTEVSVEPHFRGTGAAVEPHSSRTVAVAGLTKENSVHVGRSGGKL